VFGSASRTPVAITLLIKRKNHQGKAAIHYLDIGDYLSREQKLEIVSSFGSYQQVPWQTLEPNEYHDWINQRSGDFNAFVPFNDEPDAIFALRSNGVQTNRDAWVYNSSKANLETNMQRMIDFYNDQLALHGSIVQSAGSAKEEEKTASQVIDKNPKKIKWTRGLIAHLSRGRKGKFEQNKIGKAIYRPYGQSWIYYDQQFNEYFKEKIFPSVHYRNPVIQVTGVAESKDFSCLISNILPDL